MNIRTWGAGGPRTYERKAEPRRLAARCVTAETAGASEHSVSAAQAPRAPFETVSGVSRSLVIELLERRLPTRRPH